MTEQTNSHIGNDLAPFDPLKVPLEGSNLIEASAGTGKTYSIAILALRLLMEKELSIKEILMVTFTKAAVAELEERIRLFVRQAVLVSQGNAIEDKTITRIVNQCIAAKSTDKVRDLLSSALTFLDETSVMTIHSFCQQALREFAFETKQPFGAELLVDDSALLTAGVHKFWREHIATMPLVLLEIVIDKDVKKLIVDVIKNEQAGKSFYVYQPGITYSLDAAYYNKAAKQAEELNLQIQEEEDRLLSIVEAEWQEMISAMNANRYAPAFFKKVKDDPRAFMMTIFHNHKKPQYIQKLYKPLLDEAAYWFELQESFKKFKQQLRDYIYCAAIQQISHYIHQEKVKNNQLSFDDLIEQLHQGLMAAGHHKLIAGLQQKYKAVFIDEFQDTDRLQYEIFQKAFGKETIIFYIGDPKQSIYAFRRADIDTYLKASREVDHAYGMNINFRSSDQFIRGMNAFFLPEPDFDTFSFQNQAEQAFGYIPVKSPPVNTKGTLLSNNAPETPIEIIISNNKQASQMALVTRVAGLLDNELFKIQKNSDPAMGTNLTHPGRRIVPSDLGILVGSNDDAKFYKAELSKRGIPAIVIGDEKILTSPEAVIVQYLLEAMLDLSRATINRALLSTLTGYSPADVLALSDTQTIDRFKKYKLYWEKDGIYRALFSFVTDFDVLKHLLSADAEAGERIITNLYQIIELLYKNQVVKNYAPPEIIDWLKRGRETGEAMGDEYTQRIESDSNSVTIMTIHKSKGLQFNIVLSSSLDMTSGLSKNSTIAALKNSQQEYISVPKDHMTDELEILYEQQSAQENRRKLYVAVTRAVYKCYVFKYNRRTKDITTLEPFIRAFQEHPNSLIQFKEEEFLPRGYRYHPPIQEEKNEMSTTAPSKIGQPVHFSLFQKNWTRLSYTYLAAAPAIHLKKQTGITTSDYDHFIFHELARGSKTGNMLHYIFEHISFGSDQYWEGVIDESIKRFAPSKSAIYKKPLLTLLSEVLHTQIQAGAAPFPLSSVNNDHRLHEFEFDFPVKTFQPADLQFLAAENRQIQLINRENLEGLMNGKIDLLFEQGGKFYILDWKSTFLGDTLDPYYPNGVAEAMNNHNYHLQYFIYTVAVKKYLASRIPGFDYTRDFGGVIYVFVRGVRKGKNTGLYTFNPPKKQVDQLEAILSGSG